MNDEDGLQTDITCEPPHLSAALHRRSDSADSLDAVSESPLQMSPSHTDLHDSKSATLASPSHSPMQTGQLPVRSSEATLQATPGVIPDMEGKSPVDFFRLLFDEHVMQLIFTETSRYADQYMEREKVYLDAHPNARAHEWHRTALTPKEMDAFVTLLIAEQPLRQRRWMRL